MARREHRAAILERFDGNIERADFACDLDDFLFIEGDERPENRQLLHGVSGHGKSRHGLACDLAEAFAGDKSFRFKACGCAFGKPHHKAAQKQRKVILAAIALDGFLNLG